MNDDWTPRYEAMQSLAKAAGQIALSYFDRGTPVETKADDSPVTIADRSAEKHLRDELTKLFRGDGFRGEEYGHEPGTTGYRWIIDPIDGTRCFVRNIPHWATLVALEYQGKVVAGVAYEPVLDRMYRAAKGTGTFRDDKPIHVSTISTFDKSMACYPALRYFQKAGKESQFLKLVNAVDRTRGFGDYYGFLLVAQGSCELMVDHGVHIWDIAPLKIIVEEAGGTFTDWAGGDDLERPDCLASNGRVHQEALAILQS